ncbi:hypothetical protein [Parasphingorhabdus sp.]|jgi:hypothetical protein|uniref:hypothetical protein n=1 Tax=Parasphingorhabdus sp. TaxID=2709688 RepID=UPI0039E4B347
MTKNDDPKRLNNLPLALSRWDNEGGHQPKIDERDSSDPEMTNTELVQLRVRVIALENIVLALLADQPAETYDKVREMAELISPRQEATQHPLTIEAALHMNRFADRAERFRGVGNK